MINYTLNRKLNNVFNIVTDLIIDKYSYIYYRIKE